MSAGGYVRRGFCPQGVLFRGLCPQGVLSARGYVLDSTFTPYVSSHTVTMTNVIKLNNCHQLAIWWLPRQLG